MNVLAMFCYSSQGYIERIVFQQTKEKQTAYLNRLTKLLEMPQSSKTFLSVFSGGEIATSSFGPHAPELSELWVPSRDKNRTIPVTCAYTRETSVVQQSLLPVVMHFHCGGMTFGSVKAELDKVRYIAAKSKSVVCSVEYRLAPEHPFPAGLNDAFDASMHLLSPVSANSSRSNLEHKLGIDVDLKKVATFGYSAGGYLSGLVARLLSEIGVRIGLQISIAPMVQPHEETKSMLKNWNAPVLTKGLNAFGWSIYLPNKELASNFNVSLLADLPEGLVAKMPPVYLQINTKDVLYSEGELYANKLKSQGRLLAMDVFDTNHIGVMPGLLSRGGPGSLAFDKAVDTLVFWLEEEGDKHSKKQKTAAAQN